MPRTAAIALPALKICKSSYCSQIATGFSGYCYGCDTMRSLRNYSASPKPRASIKNPMGVEIECFNPDTVRKVTHVSAYVCSDGSLPSGGGEIKLCKPENKMEDEAADVIQRSRLVGNQVDKKCGLHLHFKRPIDGRDDMLMYNREARARLFNFLVAKQDFLFDISAPSRRKNIYCKRIASDADLFSHYAWFSVSSRHPTYEIRLHGGTLNPWKVKGWINAWTQLRPIIDDIILGNESYATDGKTLIDYLARGSIGRRYLQARLDNNGVLTNFGFNS